MMVDSWASWCYVTKLILQRQGLFQTEEHITNGSHPSYPLVLALLLRPRSVGSEQDPISIRQPQTGTQTKSYRDTTNFVVIRQYPIPTVVGGECCNGDVYWHYGPWILPGPCLVSRYGEIEQYQESAHVNYHQVRTINPLADNILALYRSARS